MLRLSSIHIRGFKRFNDLSINNIPIKARLIVVAGENGLGKSSLFDAFRRWALLNGGLGWQEDQDYYNRLTFPEKVEDTRYESLEIKPEFGPNGFNFDMLAIRKAFYIRSAYRNDPELSLNALSKVGAAVDERRIQRLIENDATVTNNYQRLVSDAFDGIFETVSGSTTIDQWREGVVGNLREAMNRLFPGLVLSGLGSPMKDPTFRFSKGVSKKFTYKNLSGGEKAAFDLLLDLIVKGKEFNDTIFCLDEPEVHINPKIHGALLNELLLAIPEGCQLWIATHSIGMLRGARDLERKEKGSVAFLNFENRFNFDLPVIISPTAPTRAFWESALQVALHDLAELVAPEIVVVCEGSPRGDTPGKNAEHDAICYTNIFNSEFPEVIFVAGGNSKDVASDRLGFAAKLPAIVQGMSVHRLIDRDDHGMSDLNEFSSKGISVLSRRNIEGYLWDDEVLSLLCIEHNDRDAITDLLERKTLEQTESRKREFDPNDLRKIAPSMFVYVRRRLKIYGQGDDARAFERNVLSHLIRPEMAVYEDLKKSIFD